jgi:2-keto-myo-inositol isomerase
MDFALNQKTAPKLGFAAFLDLAAELGCVGVGPRNDLGRPVFDGIEPVRAGEMARERGLRFIGLSEVYPFNDWNEDRRAAVAGLIETAQAAGAETVSFIPRVDGREGDGAERAKTLRAVLAEILPMLHGTGVVGLVEPIGFSTSSIKFQREATQAIETLGADDRLGIVHDTFQHALAGDADLVVRHIRLVHISGVEGGSGILTDLLDAQRVLVDEADRAGALGQMKSLLHAGYTGPCLRLFKTSTTSRHRSTRQSPICAVYWTRYVPSTFCSGGLPLQKSARLLRESESEGAPLPWAVPE